LFPLQIVKHLEYNYLPQDWQLLGQSYLGYPWGKAFKEDRCLWSYANSQGSRPTAYTYCNERRSVNTAASSRPQ